MKAAFIIALVGTLATLYLSSNHMPTNYSEDQWEQEFMNYVSTFRKSYASQDEFAIRKTLFKANYEAIDQHNRQSDKTYTMAVNEFADQSADEFQVRLGLVRPDVQTYKIKNTPTTFSDEIKSINWYDLGKVHEVKDQGACGSCWAFATMGAAESAYAIKTGTLPDFSEQQLVDCSE